MSNDENLQISKTKYFQDKLWQKSKKLVKLEVATICLNNKSNNQIARITVQKYKLVVQIIIDKSYNPNVYQSYQL